MEKIMSYLKPNFTNSLINYAFVLLVGLGSFSWSSIAFSNVPEYIEGYYWESVGVKSNLHSVALEALKEDQSPYTSFNYDFKVGSTYYYKFYFPIGSRQVSIMLRACTSSEINQGYSYCSPPPPENDCPEYGEMQEITELVNGTVDADGNFVPNPPIPDGGLVVQIGGSVSKDGCEFAIPIGENMPPDYDFKGESFCSKSQIPNKPMCYRVRQMMSTFNPVEPGSGHVNTLPDNPDFDPVIDGTKNLNESTSDHFKGAAEVIDYEGVAATKTTEVDTEVRDKGAVILETDETAVITESEGIQKTVTTTTTEVEYPDGTRREIVESNTSYYQSDRVQFTIDKSSGMVSITSVPGSSASADTIVDQLFDAVGNLIGSETTQTSDGEGDAAAEKAAEECKADPESDACSEGNWKPGEGEKKGFDVEGLSLEHQMEWAKINEKLADIKTELDGMFSISPSSGSLSCYSFVEYNGVNYDFCLTEYVEPLGKIGNALFLIVMLLAAGMILGGRTS